jgi:hypothetical protein
VPADNAAMDFSTLPKWQPRDGQGSNTRLPQGSQGISPPLTRTIRDLALLVAFVVMLYVLRQMTAALERPRLRASPLAFKVVEERYNKVHLLASREEVEELLGPPTQRHAAGPDLQEAELAAQYSSRHVEMPVDRFWHKWVDTNDEARWVAVLYAGQDTEYKVCWILKNGF